MWNKYKRWFEAFDILSFKILPTSENCLSLDKWKKSSPPLTYLQKCKLENTWRNKFHIFLYIKIWFCCQIRFKTYFKDFKTYSKDFKTYAILGIERNLLHNKAQPVGSGERVFEALRDIFWRPTRKECDGLLLLRWISFWYSEVHGCCCCWITYYEERVSGALKDSVLCHRVLHLVLLYDYLQEQCLLVWSKNYKSLGLS